jgi:hypothetical protein
MPAQANPDGYGNITLAPSQLGSCYPGVPYPTNQEQSEIQYGASAASQPGPPQNLLYGNCIVWQTYNNYPSYQFCQVRMGTGQQAQPQMAGQQPCTNNYFLPAVMGTWYDFKIQGCNSGTFGSSCSAWSEDRGFCCYFHGPSVSILNQIVVLNQSNPPTPAPPPAPVALQTYLFHTGIYVTWSPNGDQGSVISRSPAFPKSADFDVNLPSGLGEFSDTSALPGRSYRYTICDGPAPQSCASIRAALPLTLIGTVARPNPLATIAPTPPALPSQKIVMAPPGGASGTSAGMCRVGLVWRSAYSGDHICVTVQTRTQALADNKAASEHESGNGQCIAGYVWREANPQDHVCVLPLTRSQTRRDNAANATSK